MLLNLLYLLAALAPSTLADVQFTLPAAGASIPAGGTFAVEWKDSGSAPSIAELASYQLFLCAGGNAATDFVGDPLPLCTGWIRTWYTECITDTLLLLADSTSSDHNTRGLLDGQ